MTPMASLSPNITCPYCQAPSRFFFSFYLRSYYHCPSCDLIFLLRQENSDAITAYYQERYFDDHADDQTEGSRMTIYTNILNQLERQIKRGYLLDVGCGCGFFLQAARARGWRVLGVDPSEKSIVHAQSLIPGAVLQGTLNDLPHEQQFNAVTLINVFDHIPDAWMELKKIKQRLLPGGLVYLRMPNGLFHASMIRVMSVFTKKSLLNPLLVFHEYAVTPGFLKRCIEDGDFVLLKICNARPSGLPVGFRKASPKQWASRLIRDLIWIIYKIPEKMSGGSWIWGPSLEIIIKKS